jgi:hypothetical protein
MIGSVMIVMPVATMEIPVVVAFIEGEKMARFK